MDGPVLRKDLLDLRHGSQVMQLPEIEMICPQPLQAVIENPQRAVTAAICCFRGEEDLIASPTQRGTIIVHTRCICRCRVTVVHPTVERSFDDASSLCHVSVRTQNPFAA